MIDHEAKLAEGQRRYGTIQNASELCSVCDHPKSEHNDHGAKCKTCGCRGFVARENAEARVCDFCHKGHYKEKETSGGWIYTCDKCGQSMTVPKD